MANPDALAALTRLSREATGGALFLKAPQPMPWNKQHKQLLEDVRRLKADLETLAAGSSLYRDAYFDAADMTKFVLEKAETRTQK